MTEEPRIEISRRWMSCVDLLIRDGWAASYRDFCNAIEIKPQSLNDIKSGRRGVTLEMVYDTCKTYPVFLEYVIMGTGPMSKSRIVEGNVEPIVEETPKNKINSASNPLQSASQPARTEIIVATQDTSGNPTYAVVNHKAAANYLEGYQSQEYYEDLGVVTLPRALTGSSKQGIFFQIYGESMLPKFAHGDWVACVLLDKSEWLQVRDFDCYVVVSKEGIQFKRVKNRLNTPLNFLRCKSDNRRQRSFNIPGDDLLQLFRFVLHVSPDASNPEDALYQKVDHLEDTTTDLRIMFEQMQERLDELEGTKKPVKNPEKAR